MSTIDPEALPGRRCEIRRGRLTSHMGPYGVMGFVTAKYIWNWTEIDNLNTGSGEGWGFNNSQQLTPGQSVQRVIFRIGCAGASGLVSGTQQLSAPAWLGTAAVFLFDPDGIDSRPLWSQDFGMAVGGWSSTPVDTVGGGFVFTSTWASPALEFDSDVRHYVPPDKALFLGWSFGALPVPQQDPSRWTYGSSWRTKGHLQWLSSSTT